MGVRRHFGKLPLAGKAGLAGLVLLVAFTPLSPVFAVVAAVAFVASLVAVAVRLAQRRPVVGWAIGGGASLVLALFLSGAAGIVYGGGASVVGGFGRTVARVPRRRISARTTASVRERSTGHREYRR